MSILRKIAKKIFYKTNSLIKRGHWYNEVMFPDCKKFWDYNTYNTDVINLGSTSGVFAFNYEGLPIKGANWALGHNPLLADYAILKNYESYLNPHKSTCIISLCVFSSLAGSYDYMEDRYYTLLYPSSIPHFSHRRQQQIKAICNIPLLQYSLFSFISDIKSMFRKNYNKIMDENEMEQDAERWIRGWFKEFSLTDFSTPLSLINKDAIEDAAVILNQMIAFCKIRNITPIIVLPPMYHTLAKKFSIDARRILLYSLIEKVTDKSIEFYNYMDDIEFTNNRELFLNSFFLNSQGAKLFTKRVLSDLKLI